MTRQVTKRLFHLAHADLVKLRIFATIVRQRGLSPAADELGVSLPTVSRALADFEIRIGMPLCTRGRGGFSLTPEGAQLASAAEEMLDGVSRFESEVNRVSAVHRGSLRIGIIDNVIWSSDFRIAKALSSVTAHFPGIYPEVLLLQQATLEEAVRNRTVDVGITADPQYYQSLKYNEIFTIQSCLYVAKGSTLDERLKKGEAISNLPYVRRRHRAFTFHKVEQRHNLQPGATADGLEAAAMLVAAGAGIGFLAREYVQQMPTLGLRAVDHECSPFPVQFFAVTRASVSQAPALLHMMKLLGVNE